MDHSIEISRELKEVSQVIELATDDGEELVKKPLRQTIQKPGKLLRPALMLWAAGCGKCRDKKRLLMAAAAVELLHVSSLIHDDIIDDGKTRRGNPCVHSAFGNSVAVYTGDFTIIKSYKLLHDSGNDGLIYDFIMATEKLCKSDIIQYQNRGRELREADYARIAAGKTGALFALSMKVGARLGGLDQAVEERFARLGEAFGIAFQMADDCLDYTLDGKLDKSAMKDIRQGLYTMPLILALKGDDGTLRELLNRERTEETLLEICRRVNRQGVPRARERVRAQVKECRDMLASLTVDHTDRYFSNLLDGMEERNR